MADVDVQDLPPREVYINQDTRELLVKIRAELSLDPKRCDIMEEALRRYYQDLRTG